MLCLGRNNFLIFWGDAIKMNKKQTLLTTLSCILILTGALILVKYALSSRVPKTTEQPISTYITKLNGFSISSLPKERIQTQSGHHLYKVFLSSNEALWIVETPEGNFEKYSKKNHEALFFYQKMSAILAKEIAQAQENEPLTISIFGRDIDQSALNRDIFQTMGLTKASESSVTSSDLEKLENSSDYDTLLKQKRKLSIKAYQTHNEQLFKSFQITSTPLFVSKFSPFFIVQVTKKELTNLINNPAVLALDLENFYSHIALSNALNTTGTLYTQEELSLTGDSIKVGVIEVANYPDLYKSASIAQTKIIYDYNNGQEKFVDQEIQDINHASQVISILAGSGGILPDASIYVASIPIASDVTKFYSKVEWLLESNVHLINFSGYVDSYEDGDYRSISRWLDHLISTQYITFVSAVGNNGKDPQKSIPNSSMAYNAIVVGSEDPAGNISSFSSFRQQDKLALKPDLTAPGELTLENNQIQGTSYAAPIVSGTVGQIIQSQEDLKIYPETIKAILLASTTHQSASDYGDVESNNPHWSNTQGSGSLNAKDAIAWIVSNNRYLKKKISFKEPFDYTINLQQGERYRVSLCWNKAINLNTENPSSGDYPLTDLDLSILDFSQKVIDSSTSARNNVEILDFIAPNSGDYTIRVKPYSSSEENGWIGLAWW